MFPRGGGCFGGCFGGVRDVSWFWDVRDGGFGGPFRGGCLRDPAGTPWDLGGLHAPDSPDICQAPHSMWPLDMPEQPVRRSRGAGDTNHERSNIFNLFLMNVYYFFTFFDLFLFVYLVSVILVFLWFKFLLCFSLVSTLTCGGV